MSAPPYDEAAEVAVLGAMVASTTTAEEVMRVVGRGDFYVPAHARLFACFEALRLDGHKPTAVTVADWMRAHPGGVPVKAELLDPVLADDDVLPKGRVAQIVSELSVRRTTARAAETLRAASMDPAVPLTEVERLAHDATATVTVPAGAVPPGPDIDAFLATTEPEHDYDWLVPGLLERQDRVILTGWSEGGGKSVLLRQLSMQAAAGLVWFTRIRRMDALRVVYVDAENGVGITRRWFRSLRITAGSDLDDPSRLVVHCRPAGVDLGAPHDRAWLAGVCEANRPDLLVIGPLYKLHHGDPNGEQEMKALTDFLDVIRDRYDVALLMEAHTPNKQGGFDRQDRPRGSGVWRGWTEFGLALHDTTDGQRLHPWKQRDERDWPDRLARGGEWPWMPVFPQPTLTEEAF